MNSKKNKFKIKTAVITISDKAAAKKRVDLSGPLLRKMIEEIGAEVVFQEVIPDIKEEIKNSLIDLADQKKVDLILTTGGTGLASRDLTPEATLEVIEKEVPGIPEKIRADTLLITPLAALSRARAGIRKKTLIINFPGSPKAVKECLESIRELIPHGVKILKGEITEHDENS